MNKKIGFIGAGNMAQAIIGGMIKSDLFDPKNIIVSATRESTLEKVEKIYGIKTTLDSNELVKSCDIIVVAVKPNVYDYVIDSVKEYIDTDKIIVTIAAGKTIKSVEDIIGYDKKIIRTMPNTPSLVNEGMTSLTKNKNISTVDMEIVKAIFDSIGKSEVVNEDMIDAVIGASGSAPAYVFMFIEAMADAAVLYGMPRDKAYKFAAQAVMGSAKMVLETEMHPGELKDMVCSPGGTTIEAVRTLESNGFKSAVIEAMVKCMEKSKKMSM